MAYSILKNIFFGIIIFLSFFGCSEKAYIPYTILTEYIYSNKELYQPYFDSKTGDVYRPYQEKSTNHRRFQLEGLLTDDNLVIPFHYESENALISEIKDSMMYFTKYDPKGEWDSLKTIKYKITSKRFIPIDSITQLAYHTETTNSYPWKNGCETIFWRLTGKDFQNGIETKIISLDSVGNNEYLKGICSKSGRFKITQTRCSDDALIYSKEINTGLSEIKNFSELVIVNKLYHVGNKIFLIISPKYSLNEIVLGWLDLKSGKFNKTKITNYYRTGSGNGFRPVIYDNSKKVVIPRVGVEPIRHCETFYDRATDYHISCYDTKTGKAEWHINFIGELKDSFSSAIFYTQIIDIFKLNQEEIGVIYKRSHTDALLTETPPTLVILDRKGKIKQKIPLEHEKYSRILPQKKGNVVRFSQKNLNQYLIKGKIEEDSKYYSLYYFQNELWN